MTTLTPEQAANLAAQELANDPHNPELIARYSQAILALPYYNKLAINGYLFRVRSCVGCKTTQICMMHRGVYLCRACFMTHRVSRGAMTFGNIWESVIQPAYDEAAQDEGLQEVLRSCA